jgi:hypothetical protein
VVKTASSTKLLSAFEAELDLGITTLRSLKASSALSKEERKVASTSVLFGSLVAWERFLSDLLVQRINQHPSQWRKQQAQAMSQSLRAKFGAPLADHLTIPATWRPTVAEVRSCVDSGGMNLTFRDPAGLKEWASNNLSQSDAARFIALTSPDDAFLTLLDTLRNVIAHRSIKSIGAFGKAVTDPSLPRGYLRSERTARDLGAYLMSGTVTRSERILTDLKRLAQAVAS